jgi:hypothetical protein
MSSNAPTGVTGEIPEETIHDSMGPIMKPLDLTKQCHHYQHVSEVPWDIQK